MAEWISVKDRLPEFYDYEKVLVRLDHWHGVDIYMAFYDPERGWCDCGGYFDDREAIAYETVGVNVTHWMPRPKLPEEMYATPSRMPTPDRIRHLAEILENEYSDRTVTIDKLIYMLRRLADVIAEDEPPKEEP